MGLNGTLFPYILFLMYFLLILRAKSKLVTRTTYIVSMDMAFMSKVFINHHNWYSSTIGSLKSANLASLDNHQSSPSLLYNYDHAVHGFAAHLSKHELEALKKLPGFVSASEDRTSTLHTTHTPEFLSLHSTSGLWLASNQGKDVIIGVIDTGFWPESKSFKDR